jgi:predicted NBD/HSP70 family sugar kinase
MTVFVDNDSNVMAIAEHTFGVAKGTDHALCVNINECIGLGMILNGKPYSGARGMAGEFGHVRLPGLDLPCYCGKTGCLESVASGRAIITAAREAVEKGIPTAIAAIAGTNDVTLANVIAAALQDDIFAIELLQRAGEKIGEGIATLIHLFNPCLLVIGGEIADAGDHVIAPIMQAINKYTLGRLRIPCEVKLSTLNADTTIMGTLMLVMQDLYYDDNSDFFHLAV